MRQAAKTVEKLDPVWDRIREEAEAIARHEPALGGFIFSLVLNHESFEEALTLFGATTVFAQLQYALNRVWRVKAAPRAGLIAEVCVAPGQAVGHGDTIVRYTES